MIQDRGDVETYVFLIDDDIDIRQTVTELLDEEGYRVVPAENGEAALERLTTDITLPCVILLDLMMPVMSGEQFREHQLEDSRLAEIPVIVMSASYEVTKVAARACGCRV